MKVLDLETKIAKHIQDWLHKYATSNNSEIFNFIYGSDYYLGQNYAEYPNYVSKLKIIIDKENL